MMMMMMKRSWSQSLFSGTWMQQRSSNSSSAASFPQKQKWKLSRRNTLMHLWSTARPARSVCQQPHSSQSHFLKNLQRPQNHQTSPSRLLPPSPPPPSGIHTETAAEQQNHSTPGHLSPTSASSTETHNELHSHKDTVNRKKKVWMFSDRQQQRGQRSQHHEGNKLWRTRKHGDGFCRFLYETVRSQSDWACESFSLNRKFYSIQTSDLLNQVQTKQMTLMCTSVTRKHLQLRPIKSNQLCKQEVSVASQAVDHQMQQYFSFSWNNISHNPTNHCRLKVMSWTEWGESVGSDIFTQRQRGRNDRESCRFSRVITQR